MIINDFIEFIAGVIHIHALCETKKCEKCGREYPSRGKRDIGICPNCLREQNFIGGPLDDKRRS